MQNSSPTQTTPPAIVQLMASDASASDARASDARASARFDRFLGVSQRVKGWFHDTSAAVWDSLLEHQARLGLRGNLLEIGVWEGKSAGLMAMHARADERCVLVDCELKIEKIQQTLHQLPIVQGLKVDALEEDSTELWNHALLHDGYRRYRWLHIDGEHTARAVRNDLEIAHRLLGKEGIVAIDDFFSWLYPQITESVMRYLREFPDNFSLFLCGFNKAYLARPHFVHQYLEFCHERLPAALELRGQTVTVAKTTFAGEMNTFGVGPRMQDRALRGPDWEPDKIYR